jgi:signal transduction histidine kinase
VTPPSGLESDVALFEQVHTALGLAGKLEDFYTVFASLLVDPGVLGLSRVFLLRADERADALVGRLALGARDAAEHERFRTQLQSETARINDMIEVVQSESPEPHAIDALLNLRFHAIWIQMLQAGDSTSGEGTSMNNAFQSVQIRTAKVSTGTILHAVLNNPRPTVVGDHRLLPPELQAFVQPPALAGRLVTKRGVHAIVFADLAYQESATATDLIIARFQTVLNLASVALENVELVEALTETTNKLKEMDRLKTNFLSIVSHELRTPLTSILGFLSLVAEEKVGPVSEAQQDLLRRVVNHSLHLQDMVNDLLEVAEIESGGMLSVTPATVDPLAVVLNVIPVVNSRRSSRNPKIEPIPGLSGVPMIRSDARALERILFHLIDNAVKFSQTSEAKVRIEFEADDTKLHVSVVDQGIGIPADQLKRIWDRFYQVDFRLERAYGGMGIGLNIVKMLLDATGGQIRVESTVGTGSRFTVSYPLATPKA